jgi:uncharacterized protein (TIGR00251 family)
VDIDLREHDGSVTLRVRVQPRASRDALGGTREGALVVRLTAAPVEGAANAALVRLVGKLLGLPASSVTVLRGATGREKVLKLAGADAAQVRRQLETILGAARSV